MAKRVLIVDDAVFMRDMIKDIFSGGEFEIVGEAVHGVEAVDKYKELVPMKRGGTADEVADVVLYLLSEKSSYVTGVLVDVAGGRGL